MSRTLGLALLCLAGCAPASIDQWSSVRPLPAERFEAGAVALGARIWFFGGITDLCPSADAACTSTEVDVYDPASDSWDAGPPLPDGAPRHHLALTVLDGRVYLVGGFTGILGTADPFVPVGTTWSFDGSGWTRLADQPAPRGSATAQAIGGRIYVAGGGTNEPDARADLSIYDPVTDSWQAGAPMPTAREHVASCALGGQLLVVGGWLASSNKPAVTTAESYDPGSDSWTTLPSMPTARGGLGAVVVDGRCYVVGGEDWSTPGNDTFAANEAYNPATSRWSSHEPLPLPRHGLGLATLDRRIYAVGGGPLKGNSYTNRVDVYRP